MSHTYVKSICVCEARSPIKGRLTLFSDDKLQIWALPMLWFIQGNLAPSCWWADMHWGLGSQDQQTRNVMTQRSVVSWTVGTSDPRQHWGAPRAQVNWPLQLNGRAGIALPELSSRWLYSHGHRAIYESWLHDHGSSFGMFAKLNYASVPTSWHFKNP